MSVRSALRHIGVASLTIIPGLAIAADFNFNVPVRLSNLPPDIDRLFVSCWVDGDNVAIGSVNSDHPISGGAFDGQVTIGFDVAPGVDPLLARRYTCTIGLAGNIADLNGQRLTFSPAQKDDGSWGLFSRETSPPREIPSSSGLNSVLRVSGDVPQVTPR